MKNQKVRKIKKYKKLKFETYNLKIYKIIFLFLLNNYPYLYIYKARIIRVCCLFNG